jgi:hypothetical protein
MLRRLRRYASRTDEKENSAPEAVPGSLPDDVDLDAIEERAGLAADRVPAVYLNAWARINHQEPFAVSDAQWRLALDDAGLFLDAWGNDATAIGWTPGELFDVTAGLTWRLGGERAVRHAGAQGSG